MLRIPNAATGLRAFSRKLTLYVRLDSATLDDEDDHAMVDAAVNANRLEIGRDVEGTGSHEQLAMATVVAVALSRTLCNWSE